MAELQGLHHFPPESFSECRGFFAPEYSVRKITDDGSYITCHVTMTSVCVSGN